MTGSLATDEQIRDLLTNSRLWFVVGLGDNPGRPAYGVARFLLDLGKSKKNADVLKSSFYPVQLQFPRVGVVRISERMHHELNQKNDGNLDKKKQKNGEKEM